MDKQRIEAVIHQTTLEKHALDKSLNAMEKENKELYRNCSMLQSQVNQLERENTSKMAEALSRRRMQIEAELHRMREEKRQLEKLMETREQNYTQKLRAYEHQMELLREQLENERKRRRESQQLGGSTHSVHFTGTHIRRTSSVTRSTSGAASGGSKPPFRV
ncbi:LFI-1 protein [Aphelenchoides avenae]|nr:LFI-1 protein [Aphelenchus avenae]